VKEYGLCNTEIPPKSLKINVHITEDEVISVFGQKVGGNGYKYTNCDDESLVKKVELRWMICHQRTSLPNTRLINISEARGFLYEVLKGKPTNWAVRAEWTCRQQLQTRIKKEDKKNKASRSSAPGQSSLGFGSGLETANGSTLAVQSSTVAAGGRDLGGGVMLGSLDSMAIEEWEAHISTLEKETPILDALVKELCTEKEAAKLGFAKLSRQLDYGKQLITNAELKLQELEAVRETVRVKLEGLRSSDSPDKELMSSTVLEAEVIQRKLDFQCEVLLAFKGMHGTGAADELHLQMKVQEAEEAWKRASTRQGLWKRHRVVLESQLKSMKSEYARLSLHPAPQPLLYYDYESEILEPTSIEICPCPFCLRKFQPIWECKLFPCLHAYHSWCVLTHFSDSIECMAEGCSLEPPMEWWNAMGLKKLVESPKRDPSANWDTWLQVEGNFHTCS
jgi:hypothetical protein